MKKRKGFTLIELLVVIAIIALLLSIIMPALRSAKRQAQAVICRSNLKQWGVIFSLYAQDNEEKLPQSYPGGTLTYQEAYWITATLPYYSAKGIRLCPSAKVEGLPVNRQHGGTFLAWGPFDPATTNDWWADFDAGGYGLNEWCACPPEGIPDYWGYDPSNAWRKITVKGASKIPLFLDSVYVDAFPTENDLFLSFDPGNERWIWPDWGDWYLNAMRLFCIDRHKETVNGVFLDLGARSVGLKELWTLKWSPNYNTAGHFTSAGGMRPMDWPDWMQDFKDY